MAERIAVNSKKPVSTKENLISHKRKTDFRSNSSPVNQILYLQRTIGNQAVQRMVRSGALQAKLRIGQPGDVYEQEADRVADAVMRMPEPQVQRQAEEEEETIQTELNGSIQRLPEEEEEEEIVTPNVQEKLTMGSPGDVYEQEADRVAKAISTEGGLSDLSNMTSVQEKLLSSIDPRALGGLTERSIRPIVSSDSVGSRKLSVNRKQGLPFQKDGSVPANIERRILHSKGSGSRLSPQMNAYMSIQTGYDFSIVRVKADSEAANLNRTLGARAFTNGSDIWLGKGEKATDVKLMGHELTHVVQQGAAKRIQPKSNAFSQLLASKGYMPKFMQALTKNANDNSSLFQKGILQFINKYPSIQMSTLQAQLLDGAKSESINRRESAQTLRGSIPGGKGGRTSSMSIDVLIPPKTTGDCGGVLSQVRWKVPSSSTDGTIVQHMHVKYDKLEKCNSTKINPNFHPHDPLEFYEAWEVKGGKIYVGWANGTPEHRSDTFSGNIDYGSGSRGKGKASGKVCFLKGYNKTTESGWGPHKFAGSLPTRSTAPKGWSAATKLDHWLSTEWECCPPGDKSKWTKTKVDGQPK